MKLLRIFLYTFIIYFFPFFAANIYAAESEDSTIAESKKMRAQVFLATGFIFGSSAKEFFEEYSNPKSFGGRLIAFKETPSVAGGLRLELGNDLRLSLIGSYFNATFHDGYVEPEALTPIGKGKRIYDQEFKIESLPIIASVEYLSLKLPYRSYFGLGAGLSITRIYWKESISSTIERDRRTGGEIYNENQIFPALKISAGSELYFDRDFEDYFLGSLTLEVSYNYTFRSVEIFKNVREQFWEPTPGMNESYSMIPGYVALNLIVSFNLPRNKN